MTEFGPGRSEKRKKVFGNQKITLLNFLIYCLPFRNRKCQPLLCQFKNIFLDKDIV